MSKKQLTAKEAITQVLTASSKPMRVPEIIAAGVPLATGLKGATPGQTFYSILYSEAKKSDGAFIKTGKGTFKLRKPRASRAAAAKPDPKPAARKRTRRQPVAA